MAEVKKEDKFFVVNLKYIKKLSHYGNLSFNRVCDELNKKFSQTEKNKYICCNQDEPYAEKVWEVILAGEAEKQEKKRHDKTVKGLQKMGEPTGRGR